MVNTKQKRQTLFWLSLLAMFTYLLSFNMVKADKVHNIPGNDYYIDEIGLLSNETKELINEKNLMLSEELGSEIIFVTTGPLENNTPFDYSVELFNKYKPGSKDMDNGMLFLLVIDKSNEKEYQLEARVGYGIEGILNDGKVGRILDQEVIPAFKDGNYDKGLQNGLNIFSNELIQNKDEIAADIASRSEDTEFGSIVFTVIQILIMLYIMSITIKGSSNTRGGPSTSYTSGSFSHNGSSYSSNSNSKSGSNSSLGRSSSSGRRSSGGGRTGGGGASR